MPATAMAAAYAAMGETELIAARKRGNAERRADLMRFFDAHGFSTLSVANHLMVDARMPTPAVIEALNRQNVYVGRPGPVADARPRHDRQRRGHGALKSARRVGDRMTNAGAETPEARSIELADCAAIAR